MDPRQLNGGERPFERRLQASVQPLDASRLEVDASRLLGVDREARVLEPLQYPLPLALDRRRILFDEHELRAHRERLPQPHPRLHAGELGGGGDRADELLGPRAASAAEDERQPRLVPQAARNSKPGTMRQAIMGTYVLHPNRCSCQLRTTRTDFEVGVRHARLSA